MRMLIFFILFSATSTFAALVCDHPVYDFGTRNEGAVIQHTFVVRNTGDQAVVIDRVRTTCGCTVATPSAKVMGAGDSIEIKAALDLHKRQGPQNRKIYLLLRNEEKRFELALTGIAESSMEMNPSFLFFGRVDPAQPSEKTITIRGLRHPLHPEKGSGRLIRHQDKRKGQAA